MTIARRWQALSISARTFLLVVAALVACNTACLLLLDVNLGPPPKPADFHAGDRRPPPPPEGRGPPGGGDPTLRGAGPPDPGPGSHVPPRGALRLPIILAIELLAIVPLAWLFAATLSAPLRRFADIAGAAGRDGVPLPVPREGPPEILAAIDGFNSMQARLHRSVQERTQMVGAIAHDLRTPLTRLAFRLDDLEGPLGDKMRADIDEMRVMIAAALDFIRDRSSRGRVQRLDFLSLVERVVEEQSDLGHDVTLGNRVSMTIEGVPLDLRRAVANLIDNAVKYGNRARLKLEERDGECRLEVEDDGPGIPAALHSQVFDPFFRIEGSRNRNTGGIGLGLATVRAIVSEHGGTISLGNVVGGGLKVTVALPLSAD
ncbi:MAG TPA: ATP-binding protein [Casimicrobiaceae bacterium]|nr:ATP-binding protein [Casimicrobiaceae bacterium]